MADVWGAGQIHYILCVGRSLNGRALDAREAEMKWMIKGTPSSMEWACQPITTDNVLFPAGVNSVVFTSFGLVPPFWCPLARSSM